MNNTSADQNLLVEKYVAGLMDEEEALEFEVLVLSSPELQQKVSQAGELFDDIQRQEWRNNIEQTLAQQQPAKIVKPKLGFSWQFSFLPSALAFGVGVLMVLFFQPAPLVLGKAHVINLEQTRSIVESSIEQSVVLIDKGVNTLQIKLPVIGDLRLYYSVSFKVNGTTNTRKDYLADEYGKLTFLLTRQFNHDELITVSVATQADSKVVREVQLLIKEK
jgi:hypothetical protein